MALEEISFFNTNGDEINLSNLVSQMINYYGLKLEVGETRLTDFNEGSEIRNILEAFAVLEYARLEEEHENTRIAFIETSYGEWLDKIGRLPFIDLERITGIAATGVVKFTLATAQSEDYVIPAGTIVASSSSELEFATETDLTILTGDTTGEVSVECLTTGEDGNLGAGEIDTIGDEIDTNLVTVTNTSAFTNGRDYEDDDDYRERLLSNVRADGFGTLGYYTSLCESVDGVHDVVFVDEEGYTKKCLVNGNNKPVEDKVLLDVLAELTDVDKKVLDHTFTVDRPTATTVDLTIALSVKNELTTSDMNLIMTKIFNGGDAFYMSFDGLGINGKLNRDELVSAFEVLDDVVCVTSVKQSGTEITTISPSSNGILKCGTMTFNQTTVGG